jgi:uncharacterized protein HemX
MQEEINKADIEPTPSKIKTINKSLIIATLALVIAMLILFITIFFLYKFISYKNKNDTLWMPIQREQNSLKMQINQLSLQVEALKTTLADDKNQFEKMQEALNKLSNEKKTQNLLPILKQIDDLQTKVKTLTPLGLKGVPEPTAVAENSDKSWRNFWQQNLKKIKSLIIIRYHTRPIEPILTLEQESDLNIAIILAFQQAEFAAMRGDVEAYQLSLQQAEKLISNYYIANDNRHAMLQEIIQLKSQTITS